MIESAFTTSTGWAGSVEPTHADALVPVHDAARPITTTEPIRPSTRRRATPRESGASRMSGVGVLDA